MAFYGRTGGPRRRKDEPIARMLQGAVEGFVAGRAAKKAQRRADEDTAYERAAKARAEGREERRVKAAEDAVVVRRENARTGATERIIKRTDELTQRFLAKQPKPPTPLDPTRKAYYEALTRKANTSADTAASTAADKAAASRNDLDVLKTIMQEVQDELRQKANVPTKKVKAFAPDETYLAPDPNRGVTAADVGAIRQKITEAFGKTTKPERMSELLRTVRENWTQLGGSGPPPQIGDETSLQSILENPDDVDTEALDDELRKIEEGQ